MTCVIRSVDSKLTWLRQNGFADSWLNLLLYTNKQGKLTGDINRRFIIVHDSGLNKFFFLCPCSLSNTCFILMKLSRFLLIATLSYTLLLSRWVSAATKSQDSVDNAEQSQEEQPLSSSSQRPYGNSIYKRKNYLTKYAEIIIVGIPIVTWKILDKDAKEREDVCIQQLAFCSVSTSLMYIYIVFLTVIFNIERMWWL